MCINIRLLRKSAKKKNPPPTTSKATETKKTLSFLKTVEINCYLFVINPDINHVDSLFYINMYVNGFQLDHQTTSNFRRLQCRVSF